MNTRSDDAKMPSELQYWKTLVPWTSDSPPLPGQDLVLSSKPMRFAGAITRLFGKSGRDICVTAIRIEDRNYLPIPIMDLSAMSWDSTTYVPFLAGDSLKMTVRYTGESREPLQIVSVCEDHTRLSLPHIPIKWARCFEVTPTSGACSIEFDREAEWTFSTSVDVGVFVSVKVGTEDCFPPNGMVAGWFLDTLEGLFEDIYMGPSDYAISKTGPDQPLSIVVQDIKRFKIYISQACVVIRSEGCTVSIHV